MKFPSSPRPAPRSPSLLSTTLSFSSPPFHFPSFPCPPCPYLSTPLSFSSPPSSPLLLPFLSSPSFLALPCPSLPTSPLHYPFLPPPYSPLPLPFLSRPALPSPPFPSPPLLSTILPFNSPYLPRIHSLLCHDSIPSHLSTTLIPSPSPSIPFLSSPSISLLRCM